MRCAPVIVTLLSVLFNFTVNCSKENSSSTLINSNKTFRGLIEDSPVYKDIAAKLKSVVAEALKKIHMKNPAEKSANQLTDAKIMSDLSHPKCGQPAVKSLAHERIVGGKEAEPHSIPWQIMLKEDLDGYARFICGGSIITETVVITAAHCLDPLRLKKYVLEVGVHETDLVAEKQKTYDVSSYVIHEEYSRSTKFNDLAILHVGKKIKFNEHVSPICLPAKPPGVGDSVTVSGWGKVEEFGNIATKLMKLDTGTLDNQKDCNSYTLNKNQICAGELAGGKDSCQGDSGGPLFAEVGGRYLLYGVVSYGHGCAREQFPGVYVNIAMYLDWIGRHMNNS